MSHHPHDSHKHDTHNHGNHQHASGKKGLHRDWRLWLGVALACAAMLAYVLSDDEALQPGGNDQAPVPAVAE